MCAPKVGGLGVLEALRVGIWGSLWGLWGGFGGYGVILGLEMGCGGVVCPKSRGFWGPGGSQGGDWGVPMGFGGWVWGLSWSLGVLEEV